MRDIFYERIINNPIIAAINDINKVDLVLQTPCEIVFLLSGSIFNIKDIVTKIKNSNKSVYVHIDLIDGFSKDMVALEYINDKIKPDGIITTKGNLVRAAKEKGIFVIQRLFILDSIALDTGIKSINHSWPDAIEVLPGIMPKVLKRIHQEVKIPIIAGGLIEDKEDVMECLKAGAMGISASKEEIWYM